MADFIKGIALAELQEREDTIENNEKAKVQIEFLRAKAFDANKELEDAQSSILSQEEVKSILKEIEKIKGECYDFGFLERPIEEQREIAQPGFIAEDPTFTSSIFPG